MAFQPQQQFMLVCVLLIVTAYTLALFWLNAAQEYAAWKKKYQGAEGHLRLTSERLVKTSRLARLADTKFYVQEIERELLPKPKLQIETFDKTIEDILHNPEGDPKHIWDRPRKWATRISQNLEYWLPILFAAIALVSLILSLSSLRESLT